MSTRRPSLSVVPQKARVKTGTLTKEPGIVLRQYREIARSPWILLSLLDVGDEEGGADKQMLAGPGLYQAELGG